MNAPRIPTSPMKKPRPTSQYKFDPKIAPLSNPAASIHYLPDPKAGVLNAKYLIETFVMPHMPNSSAYIDEFQSYSSTACASIGTVSRAMNHIQAKFKVLSAFPAGEPTRE